MENKVQQIVAVLKGSTLLEFSEIIRNVEKEVRNRTIIS